MNDASGETQGDARNERTGRTGGPRSVPAERPGSEPAGDDGLDVTIGEATGVSASLDRTEPPPRAKTSRPERPAAAETTTASPSPTTSDPHPAPTVAAVDHPPGPASAGTDQREEELRTMSDEDTRVHTDDGRQTEHAADFLTGLVSAFGLPATVSTHEVDDLYDEIRVEGADLGLLIGPKAGALDAIQELTRVVAQRRSGGRGESRLRVDVAGYRQKRREALERFTRRLAEEVLASGVTKALEPMNSADRKVVHDTVGTMDGVSTLSEGEDPRRRVVITPRA